MRRLICLVTLAILHVSPALAQEPAHHKGTWVALGAGGATRDRPALSLQLAHRFGNGGIVQVRFTSQMELAPFVTPDEREREVELRSRASSSISITTVRMSPTV